VGCLVVVVFGGGTAPVTDGGVAFVTRSFVLWLWRIIRTADVDEPSHAGAIVRSIEQQRQRITQDPECRRFFALARWNHRTKA